MMPLEQFSVGRNVAGIIVDESGRSVAELADELARGPNDRKVGLLWDSLAEPLFKALPDEQEEVPGPIVEAQNEILANHKKRIEVLHKVSEKLASDPEWYKNWLLNGNGTAEEIAEVAAAIRVAYFRATNDRSVLLNVQGVDTKQVDEEADLAEGVRYAVSQMAEAVQGLQAAFSGGGGEGLALNDPAYELKMFAVATQRIIEQLAGIDRLRMDFAERTDLVRQTAIWFMTHGLLRRYVQTLANETTGSFEWATYIDQMVQGSPKVWATWEKLAKTFSGSSQEMGSLGLEMANGVETDAMLHNMGVDFRAIEEDGKEATVKYSLDRMWNFYLGNFPKEGLRVEQLSLGEVKTLFAKYGDLLKARYGSDFNPLRIWAKYQRMKNYRRDLDFMRGDVGADAATENRFGKAKIDLIWGEVGWFDKIKRKIELNESEVLQLRKLMLGGGSVLLAHFETLDVGKEVDLDDNDPLKLAVEVYKKIKWGVAIDSNENSILDQAFGDKTQLLLYFEKLDRGEELHLADDDPLKQEVDVYRRVKDGKAVDGKGMEILRSIFSQKSQEIQDRDSYKARFKVHRGEKLTEVEQRFIDEILKQDVWESRVNNYRVSNNDGAVSVEDMLVIGQGEAIIPWFLDESEVQRFQEDVTALPKFTKHTNPFEGPLMPAWSWATRPMGITEDVSSDAYIFWEIAEAGLDPNKLVAIELPRKHSGAFQAMAIEVGGRHGGITKYEVGLLSSGGVARLGEKNAPLLRKFLYEADGKTLIRDGYGNVCLAPARDQNDKPMYEPEWDKGHKPKLDGLGNVVYQKLIGPDGNVVVDSKGREQYRPKLGEDGQEMYELDLDEHGKPIPVDPRDIMIKNVAGVRLGPIYKTFRGLWFASELFDADPVNAGQLTPKGILKGLEWKLYCWYYGINYPYGEEFLEMDKDDRLIRSKDNNAMWASGDPEKAEKFVLRHNNPMHLDDDGAHTLEAYELHQEEEASDKVERERINQLIRRLKEGESLDSTEQAIINTKVGECKWVQPHSRGEVFSTRNYQELEIKLLLEHHRYLPSNVADLYIMQNHLLIMAENLWQREMERLMPRQTVGEVKQSVANEVLARYSAEGIDITTLELRSKQTDQEIKFARRPRKATQKEEIELRKKFINEVDAGLKTKFKLVNQAVEIGLAPLAEKYRMDMVGDRLYLSPVARMGTTRQMLRRISGFNINEARGWNGFDCYDNLASMGVGVENSPRWMAENRVGLVRWVMQMGVDKFTLDDSRDMYTSDADYNGKEGDIQQQIWSSLLTSFTKTTVSSQTKARFGTDKEKIRDLDDLVYKVMDTIRGGLSREDVDKMATEIAEFYVEAWKKMSFRPAGGEREKIFASKIITGLDLMFPTVRRVRYKLSRQNLITEKWDTDVPEFVPLKKLAWGMRVAEPGKIGDRRKNIRLKIGKGGFGVGPHHVLDTVVHKKGLGTVFIANERKHQAVLLSDAFQMGHLIYMNRDGSMEAAVIDPLAMYGSEAPKLVDDIDGNKINDAKRLFADWIVQAMMDKNVLNELEKAMIISLLP